jgi:hypothetical protein
MHSVGNKPRDHRVSGAIDTLFNLVPAYPAINFEPYYTGWNHEINMPNGERPPANSERDNYFARAQMYGSVLSGALWSLHVLPPRYYYYCRTGRHAPFIWEAFKYQSGNFMKPKASYFRRKRFQNLHLRGEYSSAKAPNHRERFRWLVE